MQYLYIIIIIFIIIIIILFLLASFIYILHIIIIIIIIIIHITFYTNIVFYPIKQILLLLLYNLKDEINLSRPLSLFIYHFFNYHCIFPSFFILFS